MGKSSPEKRPGVTVNRRDLVSIPVPDANLLWRDLHVRNVERVEKEGKKSSKTNNIRVDIIVDGVTRDKSWSCGLEFDYANEESFYCRPLRTDFDGTTRMTVPEEAGRVQVAFLPPMSGLADREFLNSWIPSPEPQPTRPEDIWSQNLFRWAFLGRFQLCLQSLLHV